MASTLTAPTPDVMGSLGLVGINKMSKNLQGQMKI
jgi:hypothetical protein